MAIPDKTVWDAEPHTLAKHEILRKYLQIWMRIIGNSFRRMLYFDGFSGPGIYNGGEPGSPIVAVQVAKEMKHPFPRISMVFSEERADRKQELETQLGLTGVPPYCSVETLQLTFENAAETLLSKYTIASQPPTFTLIDPFGFSGIPLRIIQALMNRKSSECLITFMVDSMNRWLEHPNDEIRRKIVDAFGTDRVLSIVDRQPGMNRIQALRELYIEQLSGVAKHCRYFEMRDRDNRVLYYLFFISNNSLGFAKMKEAMWAVDQTGCFRYSDSTDPGQEILFNVDQTWVPVLTKQIAEVFSGRKGVPIKEVRSYVEEKTMFLDGHMKAVMRTLEAESRISPFLMKSDGSPRKKNSFPDGVMVDFL